MAPERILKGYLCACLVAAATVVLGVVIQFFDLPEIIDISINYIAAHLVAYLLLFLITLIVAVLPASLVIIAGEVFSIRNVWYYMAPAAAVGFWVTWVIDGVQYSAFDTGVFVAAGALAGLMYWYVAGRDAARGSWPRF
ncbi:hypothetical protein [Labrenzia sp. PHM005]|uniref:hypothetical protein n=1 Tax=Labrenzia sp. PHM005 TaxID=2590016 RepID=UPI0011407E88|nr:hypothetical protein [Labrenzia sp. PHM005]QDG77159.1 hypothetical protein FJ695_15480 [Labrenzia sp. PHM005]